ncbi:phosphodiesterase [Nocardioides mangrovicus]|uniref:Phosphodiesterase n=1 Tax=Nocardioides mangrovicus TaxID=2478913 RepID=A0A3L8P0V3_9ACTN|nr:GGDEF domain-containing phosphodiesterase [Nocardioides mangrovicus]RLV48547.1 phosphodiesterase [Nocardioides mangrovicus]
MSARISTFATEVRWLLWALLVVAASIVVLPTDGQLVGEGVVEVGGLVTALLALRTQRDLLRLGLGTILVGMGLLMVPDVAQAVYRVGFGATMPGAIWASTPLGMLLVIVGAVRVVRRGHRLSRDGWVEATIFGVGAMTPVVVLLILPVLDNTSSPFAVVSTLLLACCQGLIIATFARLLLDADSRGPSLLLVGLAVTFSTTANSVNGIAYTAGVGFGVSAGDHAVRVLWALTYLSSGAALAHPSLRGLLVGWGRELSPVSARYKVAVLVIGLLLPATTLALCLALGARQYLWAVGCFGFAVATLAAIRIFSLLIRADAQATALASLTRADPVTGLVNRRGWDHVLVEACLRAERHEVPLSVIIIEVDGFADHAAVHGPHGADRLLRKLADTWSAELRAGERLARFGGAQFAVVLLGSEQSAAEVRADTLRALAPAPMTASAGAARWWPGTEPETVVLDADTALYLAKRDGADRTVLAEPGLSGAMPGALRDLQLARQPIVRLADDAVVAHECLSRFPHTTNIEAVFADAHAKGFGDLLEATVVSLSRPTPGSELFVNVSERAVRSTRFWNLVPDDLAGVVIELVEQRDGLSEAELREILGRFRSRGARIALDDVGSSATDFARIASLRPDVAKIDRSLVTDCDQSAARIDVLRMLVRFARAQGAEVVVEGIETPGELEVVRGIGATYAQGYLLGRPQLVGAEPVAGLAS